MKVVASYLLAQLGGNAAPTAKDIKGILNSVGADADDDKISFLLAQLKGKDLLEVIASGREKLAAVPSGGGGGTFVSSGGGGTVTAAAPAAVEEEKKEEEAKEESDDDMGFSLFD